MLSRRTLPFFLLLVCAGSSAGQSGTGLGQRSPDPFTLQALLKLTSNQVSVGGHMGFSIAVGQGRVLVGAPMDDGAGTCSGAAFLFDASTGQELHEFMPTGSSGFDLYGTSVAVDGDLALVGAPDSSLDLAGAVHLLDLRNRQELGVLFSPDGAPVDLFGEGVALSGHTAVCGAPGQDGAAPQGGAAYVIDLLTGQTLLKLTADDAEFDDALGTRVAISGDLILASAVGQDVNGSSSGAVYVFDRFTGQQLHKLTPDDAQAGDLFGQSIALDGDLAVIGTLFKDGGEGAAYLFNARTGKQLYRLVPLTGDRGQFGSSVAIEGNAVLVGAPFDIFLGSATTGAAFLFDAGTGRQVARLLPADLRPNNLFGSAVSLQGNLAAVGAKGDDEVGPASGAAYTFDLGH